MNAIIRRAHQIRKEAAVKFGGKPGDYSLKIAGEMAKAENQAESAYRMIQADSLAKKLTAIHTFEELLDAGGRYVPSFDCTDPDCARLADLYDQEQERRGDGRRAFRYGSPEIKAARQYQRFRAIAIKTAATAAAIQAINSIPAQVPSDYQPSGSSWFGAFTEGCGVNPYLEEVEGLEKDEDGDYPQETVDLYAAAFDSAAEKAAEDAAGRLDLSGWIASKGLIGSSDHCWSWHETKEEAEAQNYDWVKPYREICDQRYSDGSLVFEK